MSIPLSSSSEPKPISYGPYLASATLTAIGTVTFLYGVGVESLPLVIAGLAVAVISLLGMLYAHYQREEPTKGPQLVVSDQPLETPRTSISKGPVLAPEIDPLAISKTDGEGIKEMLTILSEGIVAILKNKRTLDELREKLSPLNPLKFWSHILTDGDLCEKVRTILSSTFPIPGFGSVADNFQSNTAQTLKRDKKQLESLLLTFVERVNADLGTMQGYMKEANWEELARYITDLAHNTLLA